MQSLEFIKSSVLNFCVTSAALVSALPDCLEWFMLFTIMYFAFIHIHYGSLISIFF